MLAHEVVELERALRTKTRGQTLVLSDEGEPGLLQRPAPSPIKIDLLAHGGRVAAEQIGMDPAISARQCPFGSELGLEAALTR